MGMQIKTDLTVGNNIDLYTTMEKTHLTRQLECQQIAIDQASRNMREHIGEDVSKERPYGTREIPSVEHVDYPQILEMLLESRDSKYVAGVPIHKCCSPIPPSMQGKSFLPLFYVCKSSDLRKEDTTLGGIPVRYQGFSKAIVWMSQSNPRYGVVARRMQHQSRIKQKKRTSMEEYCTKLASVFFNYYEGFSYVLLDRGENFSGELDRKDISTLICEDSSKLVQIWPTNNNSATKPIRDKPQQQLKSHVSSVSIPEPHRELSSGYEMYYEPAQKRQHTEQAYYEPRRSDGTEYDDMYPLPRSFLDFSSQQANDDDLLLLDDFINDLSAPDTFQLGF